MARDGGRELQNEAALMHPRGCKEPCSAVVPPHCLQKTRMEGGRHVVLWQLKEAGAADLAEEPCLWLLKDTQDTSQAAQLWALAQLVSCQHHWWRCPGFLACPVSPVSCGLCCDKPPWTEAHESAVSELAHKERFHSGSIYLFWLLCRMPVTL